MANYIISDSDYKLLGQILNRIIPARAQANVAVDTAKPRFVLGAGSIEKLKLLMPQFSRVVKRAIELTEQDFTVFETLRSEEKQRQMVNQGTSKTMQSKHLRQADGWSHAVDLVPWIDGKPVWDWDGCYKIVVAMCLAAQELGCAKSIRWGGAWDRVLSDFLYGTVVDQAQIKNQVEAYKSRHAGPDFLDGPHFEWVS